jgi:signal peptidase I
MERHTVDPVGGSEAGRSSVPVDRDPRHLTAPTWDPGYREVRDRENGYRQQGYAPDAGTSDSDYPQASSGQNGYAPPGSAPPTYGRDYAQPGSAAPVYERGYARPGAVPSGYGQPGSAQPAYGQPGSVPPAYGDNGRDRAYQDAGYREAGYQEAGYSETGVAGHDETANRQPWSRDPGYRDDQDQDNRYQAPRYRGPRDEPPRSTPPVVQQPNDKGPRKSMPLWQELPLLLVVAFCLAVLIRTFLLQAFFIPSGSMQNTLLIGDRVLVNKVVYDLRDPLRGEVVVFRGPDNWVPETPTTASSSGFMAKLGHTIGDLVGVSAPGEKDFIKRVIGVPGDKVACCDDQGRVTVNGVALNEPYVVENSPLDVAPTPGECRSRKFNQIVVQPGMLWVMGDHRLVSQDSRCQGQVPIKNVIGRAFVVVWPSSRWAGLPVPSTFASVPRPVAAAQEGPISPDLVPQTPSKTNRSSTSEATANAAHTGTATLVLPLLLSWYIPARSRPSPRDRRSRLAA